MDAPIIFFDGVCTLCNGFVDFMVKRDGGRFAFASLQGETARKNLDPGFISGTPKSIVLWDRDGVHVKSRAVLRVLSQLPGAWKAMRVFYLVPRRLSDFVYDIVADHRYRWFGRRDTCRLPTTEEKNRLLD